MRCPGCDYSLWNLPARQCPECGRPFLPSDFDFVANSVRFCCPHCAQEYYGTGPRGHLVPDRFTCVRCGHHIAMDQMVLLPTAGVAEEQTRTDTVPWLERRKIGFFRAWLRTVTRVMFDPGRLARAIPDDSPAGPALLFAIITLVTACLLAASPFGLFFLGAFGRGRPSAIVGAMLFFLVILVGAPVLLLLWGITTHLVLLSTGRTSYTLGATMRTVAYASGSSILIGIPCLGIQLGWAYGWIWPAISAAVMLRHAQGVGGVRATIAALTGPIIFIAAIIGFFLVLFLGVARAARPMMVSAGTSVVQTNAQGVLAGLEAYRTTNGRYPVHPFSLVVNNDVLPGAFTPPTFYGGPVQRPPSVLDDYSLLPDDRRKRIQQQLESGASGPADRLGDYVFTCRSIDPSAAPAGTWLFIYDPPASFKDFNGQPMPRAAATLGGTIVVIPRDQFARALAAQNSVRAGQGLPPLPDPSTVKDPADDSGQK